ncbi:flagellar hook-basal body complex protein FliE [Hydrogenispora ethanolica]|jgi:flagellar hook-basal body complex protein FliE|uniref:Flagellar hook-basal body complex protein FliE n=1 Tax=Hydrogenispora ethanolica TaxID=1082276 RepID=A0A4R1RK35_HYDET|nr:flagellar hook-basal body complex protein FliE [Hydrogenispora ethanolica]TCL66538.1 flagellar hook-basal body complex protein FliE [Hydrogenispora ethanolica]
MAALPVNLINPISLSPTESFLKKPLEPVGQPVESFGKILGDTLAEVNQLQLQSAKADEQLAAGTLDNVQDAMIIAEKASLSLQLTVQVRNKAVEAYQEIMRTQF